MGQCGPARVRRNFFRYIAEEVREYMARLGFRSMDEMIGRVDWIDAAPAVEHWKARGLDFSAILHRPAAGPEVAVRKVVEQDHGLDRSLDKTTLLPMCAPALERQEPVDIRLPIQNAQPDGGDDPARDHHALRRGGAARRHHPHPLLRLGRAELRAFLPAG